jgi:uncharacterized membrane protein YdjX (TVP38/TMEM64 family)
MNTLIRRILPFIWFTLFPPISAVLIVGILSEIDILAYFPLGIGFSIVAFLILVLVMGLAMLPTTFAAILLGYLGGWNMLPVMIVSYILSSLIGYSIGSKSDSEFWLDLIKSRKKGSEILGKISDSGPMFIFSCRLSPVLPFGLTNIVFGIFGIKIKDFLIYGAMGMLPRTILSMWIGIESKGLIQVLKQDEIPANYQYFIAALVLISTGMLIKMFFIDKKA